MRRRQRSLDGGWRGFVRRAVERLDPTRLEGFARDLWRLEGYTSFSESDGCVVARKNTPLPVRSVFLVTDHADMSSVRRACAVANEHANVVDVSLVCCRAADDVESEPAVSLLDADVLADFVVSRRYLWPLFRWLTRRTEPWSGESRSVVLDVEPGDVDGVLRLGRALARDAAVSEHDVAFAGGRGYPVELGSRLSLSRSRAVVPGPSGLEGEVEFTVCGSSPAERVDFLSTHEVFDHEALDGCLEGDAVYRGRERDVCLEGDEAGGCLLVLDVEPSGVCRVGEDTTLRMVSFDRARAAFE